MSQAELFVHFWLNCLNFKLAELSLAELSVRHTDKLLHGGLEKWTWWC